MDTKPKVAATAEEDLETLIQFISHDLRGTLKSIAGFNRLAIEDVQTNNLTAAKSNFERVTKASHILEDRLDALLTFVRMRERALYRTDIDVSQLCSEIATQKTKTYNQPVHIFIEPQIRLNADMALISVAIENLIDNALRSMNSQPEPRLTISGITTTRGAALRIMDNGIGFEVTHAKHLFKPFEKLSSQDRGRHGLGLAIAKRIVDLHGGQIWFESAPTQGTQFYIRL